MKDSKAKNWKTLFSKEDKKYVQKNDSTAATKIKDLPLNILGSADNCILCQKSISVQNMPVLIRSALYRKYSGDLDSFYSREIKNILRQRRSRAFIW